MVEAVLEVGIIAVVGDEDERARPLVEDARPAKVRLRDDEAATPVGRNRPADRPVGVVDAARHQGLPSFPSSGPVSGGPGLTSSSGTTSSALRSITNSSVSARPR